MTKEESQKLVRFVDRHFGKKEIWVSPKIFPGPTPIAGYIFKPVKHITGVVVFGDKYPLYGRDVSLEVHLILSDLMDAIKDHGCIITDMNGNHPMLVRNGNKIYLEP